MALAGLNLPMSLAEWYFHKADQCAQLAKDANEPHRRANYESEQKVWRQLGREIEQAQLKSKPKISS
jgi:hypothetical protein